MLEPALELGAFTPILAGGRLRQGFCWANLRSVGSRKGPDTLCSRAVRSMGSEREGVHCLPPATARAPRRIRAVFCGSSRFFRPAALEHV